MKLMIVSSRYPSAGNPYNHMFVHTRSRAYRGHGVEVEVFVPAVRADKYEIDGVHVKAMPANDLIRAMTRFDGIMLHLLHPHPRASLDGAKIVHAAVTTGLPVLIFLHGIEIQSIFRNRRDDLQLNRPKTFLRAVFQEFYRLPRSIEALKAALERPNCRFVTPSRWFLESAAKTLGNRLFTRGQAIPNGIDTELFRFRDEPQPCQRLVTIRPLYKSGKYALDLALRVMTHLPAGYTLDIFGRGPGEAAVKKMIRRTNLARRVTLYNTFVERSKLPELYARYGTYLAVTRWDSQGVSMCEAMAAGLPVVSFRVAAVPEFVEHGETGLLADPFDTDEMAHLITTLEAGEDANRIRRNARAFVEGIGISGTTARELSLISSLAG